MLPTRVFFSIRSIQVKLFLSLMIMLFFFLIYAIIPDEVGLSEDYEKFDLFRYTMINHMGINYPFNTPTTLRAKILTLIHLFMGYCIILL